MPSLSIFVSSFAPPLSARAEGGPRAAAAAARHGRGRGRCAAAAGARRCDGRVAVSQPMCHHNSEKFYAYTRAHRVAQRRIPHGPSEQPRHLISRSKRQLNIFTFTLLFVHFGTSSIVFAISVGLVVGAEFNRKRRKASVGRRAQLVQAIEVLRPHAWRQRRG